MLHLIVKLFQTAADIFYYIFVISFQLGNLIYYLIQLVLYFLYTLFQTIGKLLVIVHDDYATFFHDLNSKIDTLINGISYGINLGLKSTCDTISSVLNQFAYVFTTGTIKISNVAEIVRQCVGWMLLNVKACFILIGNSCWFLITLLPNFLLYLLNLGGLFLKHLLEKCLLLLVNGYKALCHCLILLINQCIDIPFQSAIGLIVLFLIYKNIFLIMPIIHLIGRIILLRMIATGRRSIQWIIPSIITLCNRIFRFRIPSPTGLFTLFSLTPRDVNAAGDSNSFRTPPRDQSGKPPGHQHSSGKKLLCVICQDQEKCMLLLPCRHLCVCYECSRKSRYYNDICPICRIPINDKVRIYV